MISFKKQPHEILDYDIDMTSWFSGIPSDNINSVEIIITADGEVLPTLINPPEDHPSYTLIGANPVVIKLWLGGGTNFINYKVTCRVRTEQDRLKEVDFMIKVQDL